MKLKQYQLNHLKKEKKRRCLPVSALIMYLMIAALLTTGVSFSRYTTSVSGFCSARVARFDVTASFPDTAAIEMSEGTGTRAEYSFEVTNNSEVAVSYDIKVSLPKALPAGIKLSMDDISVMSDGSQNEFVFPGGELGDNGGTRTHTLIITADYTALTETYYQKVSISITAVQID